MFELTEKEIGFLLDIDLKETIYGSRIAFSGMKEQGFGQIYNVERYGSNDAMMTGLSLYGTAKRAVTYFTLSLANHKNNARIMWLTNRRALCRFLTAGFKKRDFFS